MTKRISATTSNDVPSNTPKMKPERSAKLISIRSTAPPEIPHNSTKGQTANHRYFWSNKTINSKFMKFGIFDFHPSIINNSQESTVAFAKRFTDIPHNFEESVWFCDNLNPLTTEVHRSKQSSETLFMFMCQSKFWRCGGQRTNRPFNLERPRRVV